MNAEIELILVIKPVLKINIRIISINKCVVGFGFFQT